MSVNVPNSLQDYRYLTCTNDEDSITATAGGTQALAYQLNAQLSRIIVCATAGDSVALPKLGPWAVGTTQPGARGFIAFVKNDGAAAAQVFGGTNAKDTINSVATATGVSLPAGALGIFIAQSYTQSTDVGNWVCQIVAVSGAVTLAAVIAASLTGSADPLPIAGLAGSQGGAVTVTGGASSTAGNAGGAVTLAGGAGGTGGIGGAVNLTGAAGGSASGAGGAIVFAGGAGTAGNSAGGAVSITSGAGQGSANSGIVTLASGAAGATGASGAVTIRSGTAAGGASGAVTITSGNPTGGAVGTVTLTSGAAQTATTAGGIVAITGGTGNTTGAGGQVTITGGTAGNAGIGGAIVSAGAAGANAAAGGTGAAGGLVSYTSGAGGTTATGTGGASGAASLVAAAGGAATGAGTGGAGGAVAVTGGAGGGTTTSSGGAGSTVTVSAGAGGTASGNGTGGAGGNTVISAGAGGGTSGGTAGIDGIIFQRSPVSRKSVPAVMTDTATITVAALLSGTIKCTPTAAAAYTTPTGAVLAAGLPVAFTVGDTLDFVLVNVATNDTFDITLTAGASGITLLGNVVVEANSATTKASSGIFRIVNTAANTFDIYRIG